MEPLLKIRLLLIEDDEAHARLFTEIISDFGRDWYAVTSARTIAEALALLASASFEVIVLDLRLPDSAEADQTFLKIFRAAPTTPIIVLTGNEDTLLALRLLHMGAQEFLPKSLYLDLNRLPEQLARAIRYSIERQSFRNVQKAVSDSQADFSKMNRRLDDMDQKIQALSQLPLK